MSATTESHGVQRGEFTLVIRCDRCKRRPVLAEIERIQVSYHGDAFLAFYPSWARREALLAWLQHLWRLSDRRIGAKGSHLGSELKAIRVWMDFVDDFYAGQTEHHKHNQECGCSMHPPELPSRAERPSRPKSVDSFAVTVLEGFSAPQIVSHDNDVLVICRCQANHELEQFTRLDSTKVKDEYRKRRTPTRRQVDVSAVALEEPNAATDFIYEWRERQLITGPQILGSQRTASFPLNTFSPNPDK